MALRRGHQAVEALHRLDELVDEHIGLDGVNAGYERMQTGVAARSVIVFD